MSARRMAQLHLALLLFWAVMIPVSVWTGWIASVIFVSAVSLYANMATHWSAYQAAHAEKKQDDRDD